MRVAAAICGVGALLLSAGPISAMEWRLVPEASRISFETRQGAQKITGSFTRWTAQIRFDPEDLASASVEVTVELGSLRTGDGNLDRQALAPEFFDVARSPQARYRTIAFRPQGDGVFLVEAELAMKGVAQRIHHPVRITLDGTRARADGEVRLDRRLFRFEGPSRANKSSPLRSSCALRSRRSGRELA